MYQDFAAPAADAEPGNGPSDSDMAMWLGALLSALALAGLGGVAAVAIRRRRKVHEVRDVKIERPVLDAQGKPLAAAPVAAKPAVVTSSIPAATAPIVTASQAPARAPIIDAPTSEAPITERTPEPAQAYAAPAPAVRSPAPSVSPLRQPAVGQAHAGAAVALPLERPATAAERRELIERMVAARPDRANPFRSPKARRHRAKLIVQSLGRKFDTGRSRIDLSQYPMNWPELAPGRPAAA